MKASEALKLLERDTPRCPMCSTRSCEWCQRWDVMLAALREKAGREEQELEEIAKGCCSVSIAGGLVHGEFEQVKAVQALILENEKLRREARERKEQERPKVTLAEQIEACIWASGNHPPMGVNLAAAAATLRKLDELGVELLTKHFNETGEMRPCLCSYCKLLRSLGVEKKP